MKTGDELRTKQEKGAHDLETLAAHESEGLVGRLVLRFID